VLPLNRTSSIPVSGAPKLPGFGIVLKAKTILPVRTFDARRDIVLLETSATVMPSLNGRDDQYMSLATVRQSSEDAFHRLSDSHWLQVPLDQAILQIDDPIACTKRRSAAEVLR